MEAGKTDETPVQLDSPGKRAIFNVLLKLQSTAATASVAEAKVPYEQETDPLVEKALAIHNAVLNSRPDDWRGDQAKEETIKEAIYKLIPHIEQVEKIFLIIAAQGEY